MGGELLRAGLLTIGRKRPGFDAEWGRQMDALAGEAVSAAGLALVRPTAAVTDDASLRTAVEQLRGARAQALIVLQPTMGDGRLAPLTAQLWGGPLVLWATPERPEAEKVTACSLVGAHAWGATLRQLRRPFELVYGDPRQASTGRALRTAVMVCAAASRLRLSKVGLVGYHVPGFIDMHADPATISRALSVEMHHFGLQELYDLIEAPADESLARDIKDAAALNLLKDADVTDADLEQNSRYHLAMASLMDQQHLDALAVRCWPELPNRYGHWPYLAMARMTEAGRVVALEGDVDGAILGLMGKLLGLGPGYISDWLEHDEGSITLWHPGHAPLSFCEEGTARLSRHFNDRKPLVVDAELRQNEPVTIARLWRCDDRYQMTAVNARTIRPKKHFHGCSGLAALDLDVREWFDTLVHEGMPHHVTIFPGQHGETLRRLARMLGLRWV